MQSEKNQPSLTRNLLSCPHYDEFNVITSLLSVVVCLHARPYPIYRQTANSNLPSPRPFTPHLRRHLLYHIHLKSADNIWRLGKHLGSRGPLSDAGLIEKFFLANWTTDGNDAIRFILMIPKLGWLSLHAGLNLVPDHLSQLFHKPMPNLR